MKYTHGTVILGGHASVEPINSSFRGNSYLITRLYSLKYKVTLVVHVSRAWNFTLYLGFYNDVLVLPQLWLSLPHCHHSSSLCYLYHLTLASICLNSNVIVPLCDCITTIQLPSHFYRRLLYNCSTVPLQLLLQDYKCCAVHRLTTNVLKNVETFVALQGGVARLAVRWWKTANLSFSLYCAHRNGIFIQSEWGISNAPSKVTIRIQEIKCGLFD